MEKKTRKSINIRFEGGRFSEGRLPFGVLSDLQALESIFTAFARDIWLEESHQKQMPHGYSEWFKMSLTRIDHGSTVPEIQIDINESMIDGGQMSLFTDGVLSQLIEKAEKRFSSTLRAASNGRAINLSEKQIKNLTKLLGSIEGAESFNYYPNFTTIKDRSADIISFNAEKKQRFLNNALPTSYEKNVTGSARLKQVDEDGNLKFFHLDHGEFQITESPTEAKKFGAQIGNYYEVDLTAEQRADGKIIKVLSKDKISIGKNPAAIAIDEIARLKNGWLDGEGKAIKKSITDKAKSLVLSEKKLPQFYAVAPTEDGGILLEYKLKGWDYGIEFNADDSLTFFGVEIDGDKRFSQDFACDEYESFLGRIMETINEE